MAFAVLSAAGEDTVCPLNETTNDKGRVNPTRTHHPYGTQIWWILKSGDSGRISGCIATPVAEKTKDFRIIIFTHFFYTSTVFLF
jgi:hypothetical protein